MKLRFFRLIGSLCITGLLGMSAVAQDEKPIDVLFLTKSSGYEHDVLKRKNGELGHTEKVMLELGSKNNMRVVVTKDAGLINEETLKLFDVVQLYTTADLCERGGDNNPPMSPEGREALLNWIRNGGGLVGTHTATDTFHNWPPYIEMIGGEFEWHGKQQVGSMEVKKHPITSHLGSTWDLLDEYYSFKNVTPSNPLLILDAKKMEEQRYKDQDPYATTWYKDYGQGRVFQTALGHRDDVWTNPDFQQLVIKGIQWAAKRLEE